MAIFLRPASASGADQPRAAHNGPAQAAPRNARLEIITLTICLKREIARFNTIRRIATTRVLKDGPAAARQRTFYLQAVGRAQIISGMLRSKWMAISPPSSSSCRKRGYSESQDHSGN